MEKAASEIVAISGMGVPQQILPFRCQSQASKESRWDLRLKGKTGLNDRVSDVVVRQWTRVSLIFDNRIGTM
jgi:hypothetical protein